MKSNSLEPIASECDSEHGLLLTSSAKGSLVFMHAPFLTSLHLAQLFVVPDPGSGGTFPSYLQIR